MRIGNRDFFPEERAYIMGILNVTPDSFSDGGSFNEIDRALKRTEEMIKEGADIIDIGGESTRPGYVPVTVEEEIERVVPVIEAIKKNFDIPVSLDTYKSAVAKEGIRQGADLINDIWGLLKDDKMADLIGRSKTACCLMHNREVPRYKNLIEDVKADLFKSLEIAKKAGIEQDKIILDPGIGFAKTTEENLLILKELEQLMIPDIPMLLGISRKSVIGNTLGVPVSERLAGTIALNVMGRMKGAGFFRVHDIKENKMALAMAEAVRKAR